MPSFRVTDMPTMRLVELDLPKSRCRLACTFCPEKYIKDRRWDLGPAEVDEVVGEFEQILAADPRPLYLESADILEFPGLFRLLDAAKDRMVYLATPGLKLADPAFADLMVGRRLRFDLTVHGAQDDTWFHMTGRSEARGLIEAAIANVVERRIPWRASMVVTRANVAELGDTVRWIAARPWKPEAIAIKVFWPDIDASMPTRKDPSYNEQFPDLAVVGEQLASLDGVEGLPRLALDNVPYCQVDADLVERLGLMVFSAWNEYQELALPHCRTCEARKQCPGISLAYVRRYQVRRPDPAHVAKVAGLAS